MSLGIIIAFAGMLLQALTYCLVKETARRTGWSSLKLLSTAHVLMGCVCLLPFFALGLYRQLSPELVTFVLLVDGTYLVAQYFMFCAISRSDASAAGPYLILKLPMVALLSIFVLGDSLGPWQAGAIAAIVLLSLIYSNAAKISFYVLSCVMAAAACFALCDIFVLKAARAVTAPSHFMQALYCVIISDVFFLALTPFVLLQRFKPLDFVKAVPLSAAWMGGVIFTVAGFNLTSVTAGNIVLSLRGAAAVLLTALFFKTSISGEGRFTIKLTTALGMCLCVGLYYLDL